MLLIVASSKTLSMSFGNRVANLRKERGLSQQELADLIGTGKDMISRYERDSSSPSIDVAAKIAKVLNTSLDDLALGIVIEHTDVELTELVREAGSLAEEDKSHIKAVISAFITKAKVQQMLK